MVKLNWVIVKVAPASTSASLVNKFPVAVVFWLIVWISSDAKGASFTSTTVIFKLPISDPPLPSLNVYSIVGTEPTYPFTGVKV